MAYGLIAKAAALACDRDIATLAADWLLNNSKTRLGTGWGLGWRWDAFADGSENPADTVYGITTALAVDGLIETFRLTGCEKYLSGAVEALDYYKQFSTETPAGLYFWYSDQIVDAKNVHNVSSMLTGVMAVVGSITGRTDFQRLAATGLAELVASARAEGNWVSWRYGAIENARPNDLVHAAYIVYGASLAARALNIEVIEARAIQKYLTGFLDGGTPLEFRPDEAKSRMRSVRARSWGVGMLAFTLSFLNEPELAGQAMRAAADYEFSPRRFSYRFGEDHVSTRSTAHLLLGAAAVESAVGGKSDG